MSARLIAWWAAWWLGLAVANRAASDEAHNGRLMTLVARYGPVAPPGLRLAWRRRR